MFQDVVCPHCGATVPFYAEACPKCGSGQLAGGGAEPAAEDRLILYDDRPELGRTISPAWVKKLLVVLAVVTLSAILVRSSPWGLYLFVLLLFVGAYYGARRLLAGRRVGRSRLYRALLRKARGDEDLVERLIAYERRRNPHLSRTEWIEYAIDRWERDLR